MGSDKYSRPDPAPSVALTVPDDCAGLRLDQALARLMPAHSRSRLKGWIESGRVTVDGAPGVSRRRLDGGERIDVAPGDDGATLADAPQPMALTIVHEDDAVIVVDKPAGLVVHPGAGNRDGTLLNALLHRHPALAQVARAGIVHRLDKGTSGLMVVARTPEAQTDLVRQLAERSVKREYLALVRGDVARPVTVDAPIGRHPVHRTSMAVVERGREARTNVAPVERFGAATLVRCTLDTGRTHQIRVHLAAIGHPLVGDPIYGGKRAAAGIPAFARQALHAQRLGFAHPATRRAMDFASPLPGDFAALLDAMRAGAGAP
ncbi:Ribosomal large subunit pseudouridine synthase D [Burkholderiales bacterium]|nr:Ribosomal large subunit pseudouridine synthase D [Burkholderiales bacterium]